MAASERFPDFKSIFATNTASKFKEWELTLRNGARLTGIAHVPSQKFTGATGSPLLVGIHGATCSAYTYDITPEYSASPYAELFSIPFVAINRPNYLGSSGWLVDNASKTPKEPEFKAVEGSTYFQEEARWFHEILFPALWTEFAVPNGCTSLVTTSHSMSVPATIIAAALYSKDPAATGYVWAGMVLSGLGETENQHFREVTSKLAANEYQESQLPFGQDSSIHVPPYYQHNKEELMLGPPGLTSPELRPLIWKQNTPFHIQEVMDLAGTWPIGRPAYQQGVKIPVLYGLGEYEWIWKASREKVDLFCGEFSSAPRVEGACVEGAPHAIELSEAGRGWWIRVFGWAIEVAVGQAKQPEADNQTQ